VRFCVFAFFAFLRVLCSQNDWTSREPLQRWWTQGQVNSGLFSTTTTTAEKNRRSTTTAEKRIFGPRATKGLESCNFYRTVSSSNDLSGDTCLVGPFLRFLRFCVFAVSRMCGQSTRRAENGCSAAWCAPATENRPEPGARSWCRFVSEPGLLA
jgi:hypothetical protein